MHDACLYCRVGKRVEVAFYLQLAIDENCHRRCVRPFRSQLQDAVECSNCIHPVREDFVEQPSFVHRSFRLQTIRYIFSWPSALSCTKNVSTDWRENALTG